MTESKDRTRALGEEERERVLRFSSLAPGQLFADRFEVVARLGGGGAGEVFRVIDRKTREQFALKVLFPRPDLGQRGARRLQREWKLLDGLDHPGIVKVREIGQVDEIVFLVMECLEGETLGQRLLKAGPMSTEQAVEIILQVFAALGAAHSRSIVHRDIKPANIFLRDSGEVVLLDFGLAREIGDTQLTVTGQFVGTPDYVSPEQARGKKNLTPAVDVYSTGVVLWQMLAGKTPYHSDSMIEVLASHLGSPLPPVRTSLPGVEPWLRDAVAWMLEKDPGQRPVDGNAAQKILASRRRRPIWRRWRRRPRILLAAGLTTALIAALLALLLPAEIVLAQPNQLEARSLAGVTVRRWELPARVRSILQPTGLFAFFGSHRVLLSASMRGRDAERRERFPASLIDLSPWRFHPQAVRIEPREQWADGPPSFDKVHDRKWNGRYMARVDRPAGSGHDPFLLVSYGHAQDGSTRTVLLSSSDRARLVVLHSGPVLDSHLLVEQEEGSEGQLLVQFGRNECLGGRGALFAFPIFGGGRTARVISLPPHGHGVISGVVFPRYYSVLAGHGYRKLTREGNVLVAEPSQGRSVRFDLYSGVPLEERDRGGLTSGEWVRERDELFGLLSAAHVHGLGVREARELIPLLEEFSSRARSQAHSGAALYAATVLAWKCEKDLLAAELAERGVAREPYLPGHYVNLVSAFSRIGRWKQAEQHLLRAPESVRNDKEMLSRRIAEGLAAGERDRVELLLKPAKREKGDVAFFRLYPKVLFALETGNPRLVLELLEENSARICHPVFRMIQAMALLSLEDPHFEQAYHALDSVEGNPSAYGIPVDNVLAYLAVLTGRGEEGGFSVPEMPARPELDDYTAWALRPWFHALAARCWRELGDEKHALEHQQEALAAPGAPSRFGGLLEQSQGPR